MKRALLNNLVGLDTDEAIALVYKTKHTCYLVPEGCRAITMIARPNTVVLWQDDGKISSASAGDPLELED